MKLKEFRESKKVTQRQAADYVGVPLRTYIRYENNSNYENTFKYEKIFESLQNSLKLDEDNGILTISEIELAVTSVFQKYKVDFAYLFGSYAKGSQTEKSDVDIMICTDVDGLDYYGMVEELRQSLHKRVDVLRLKDIQTGSDILTEILRVGIRIYG